MGYKPFFNKFFDPQLFGASGSDYATTNQNMLLAHAFPATSLALGKEPLTTKQLPEKKNFNMQSPDFQNGWPASKTEDDGTMDWYHCDIREVAYIYTYKLFNKIVETGGLK